MRFSPTFTIKNDYFNTEAFKRKRSEFTVRMHYVFMYNSDQPQASNSMSLTVEARVQLWASQCEASGG
jgi:hypothetical protein